MSWIKRNLGFVIGSLVALGLLGLGGFYLFAKIGNANAITEEIQKQDTELGRLNNLSPHPGSGKIDNVKIAKEQEQALRAYMAKAQPLFQRVTPIPDSPKISNAEFAAQLRNTVALLRREADQASVQIPKDYYFTFEAQRRLMLFDSGSLEKLAVHLGEIKALSEIFFSAKINSLESVRRELVSTNDSNPGDYLTGKKTVSTPLADITPYEFTFKCFTPELALVLSSLASSPNGFLVKSINVEPAAQLENPQPVNAAMPVPIQPQPYVQPFYPPPGAGGAEGLLVGRRALPPVYPQPIAPVPTVQPTKSPGMTTVLNERPLKVTMVVEVVKMKAVTK